MKFTSKFVLLLSFLAIASFGFSMSKAFAQINERKSDYQVYNKYAAIRSKEKNTINISLSKIDGLEKKYGESDALSLAKIELYLQKEDYKNLQEEMEKIYSRYPSVRENPYLLLLYAESSANNGDKETAKKIINESIKVGANDGYKERVDEVLSKVK
ncbi:hypothetical protein Q3304_14615 [Clostridioides sp. GD02377]|uniref:hypothetical protein n=1 Tax=unclassified Clostridioides TaxID=2635829 RepID=UPI0038A34CB4